MSLLSEYENYMADLQRKKEKVLNEIKEMAGEELDTFTKNVYNEYAPIEEDVARRIFNESVTAFYNDYDPKYYEREGDWRSSKTGGLYDVFSPKFDNGENGTGLMLFEDEEGYTDMFDESKMHGGRNGCGLFDQVFMQGWHGGASKISSEKAETWGKHPNAGIPYYRRPGMVRYPNGISKRHRFGKWGNKAERSDKSPAVLFAKSFRKAEDGELYMELKRINDVYFDDVAKIISDKALKIYNEVLG